MLWVAPAVGMVLANIMFFSPLSVVLKKRKLGEPLGDLNPLPYPVIFANCINWVLYSLVTRDTLLFFANAPGLMVGLFCTVSSLSLADPVTRIRVEMVLFVLLGVDLLFSGFGAFIVTTWVTTDDHHDDLQKLVLGLMGNLVLLVYYAAPLSTMWEIIKTRNASSIFWPMSMANCANGFCWTVYGIVRNDWVRAWGRPAYFSDDF
eukprot:238695-Pyramimonas_sp.AAC.1